MKRIIMIALICAMVYGAVFAAASRDEGVENFPNKPVTAMVAWAPGGGGDLVFRALAEAFPKYANGQPMVIVNKGEAAGVPGIMDFMQNAKPDGYDVMHWNAAHVIKTHMDPVPFEGTSFRAVCQVVVANNYLVVPANAKWQNIQEFVADAKANPNQITMGNAGAGGGNHLSALIFEKMIGAQFRHVPFAGGGPAMTGLMTGDVQSTMGIPPEGAPNVQAGQLRILATFGDRRNDAFPTIPTGIEAGVNFAMDQWRGVVVPRTTPDAIVLKLQEIFRKCVEDATFVQRMEALGATPVFKDAKAYGDQVAQDDKMYETIIRDNRLGNRYK